MVGINHEAINGVTFFFASFFLKTHTRSLQLSASISGKRIIFEQYLFVVTRREGVTDPQKEGEMDGRTRRGRYQKKDR